MAMIAEALVLGWAVGALLWWLWDKLRMVLWAVHARKRYRDPATSPEVRRAIEMVFMAKGWAV